MRIIAGRAGGRRLAVPPEGTRPTTDRVREALFSSLDTYVREMAGDWSGVRMLDLFAGSGAVGLEALSRGAASATLVERDRRCLEVLGRNVAAVDPRAQVVGADALTWTAVGGPFDLVFVDPPYAHTDDEVRRVLSALIAQHALAVGALVVVERSHRSQEPWPPAGVEHLRKRDYGDTALWYGQVSAIAEEEA